MAQHRTSLQLFCTFYSHLGLQLTSTRKVWTLLWNLVINTTILYCLYFDDPFRLIEHYYRPPAEKPLLVMFSQYNSHYKYPLTYTLTILYYHLFGRQILRLLLKLEHGIHYSKTSLLPFLVVFTLLHLLFLIGYSIVITLYLNQSQLLPAYLIALKWFTIYANHFSAQFPLVAVHYILRAKIRTLGQIRRSLHHSKRPGSNLIQTSLQRIKSCAQVHNSLSRLTSFPLLVFLFSNSLDSIGAICAAKVHLNLSILTYQLAVFGFLLHLARLEMRSRSTFRAISLVFQPNSTTFPQTSDKVKLQEIVHVYKHQLHLHLFHLFTMEFSFALALALFILNYSVLVLQT